MVGNFSIKRHCLIFLIGLCTLNMVSGQSLVIAMPDTVVGPGTTLRYPVSVNGFDRISTIQFSMNWDAKMLKYKGVEEGNLSNVSVGESESDLGNIVVSWFAENGQSETVEDGSTLFYLTFQADGQEGDTTSVRITNNPRSIQIAQLADTPNEYNFLSIENGVGQIKIEVETAFQVSQQIRDVSCFGENTGRVQLTVNTPEVVGLVSWTGPDNFTSNELSIDNIGAGNYSYEIFDLNNELLIAREVQVTQPESPVQLDSLVVQEPTCDGAPATITVFAKGGIAPYVYQLGQQIQADSVFFKVVAGSYELSITDQNGCVISSKIEVNEPIPISFSLGVDQLRCENETITLDASGFRSVQWSTGANTPTLQINQNGLYSVTVTNAFGCQAVDSILISDKAEGIFAVNQSEMMVCPGEPVSFEAVGGQFYEWVDTSGTLSDLDIPNPIANPRFLTDYQVIISNDCQSDTLSVLVDVFEQMTNAGPDTCVGPGIGLRLFAEGGVNYLWEDAQDPVSNPVIPDPEIFPETSQTYFVNITDEMGCVWRDSALVEVVTDPTGILLPNLITPNGDGKNDQLGFPGIGKYGTNTFRVYNRWGDLVFQKVNYMSDEERFVGEYNGLPLPSGNYYYVLSFRETQFKQTLTIIRD